MPSSPLWLISFPPYLLPSSLAPVPVLFHDTVPLEQASSKISCFSSSTKTVVGVVPLPTSPTLSLTPRPLLLSSPMSNLICGVASSYKACLVAICQTPRITMRVLTPILFRQILILMWRISLRVATLILQILRTSRNSALSVCLQFIDSR